MNADVNKGSDVESALQISLGLMTDEQILRKENATEGKIAGTRIPDAGAGSAGTARALATSRRTKRARTRAARVRDPLPCVNTRAVAAQTTRTSPE